MNVKIDFENDIPAYIQLYRAFVADIVSEDYPYGSKLPSKRTIATETGLSLITVEHAISLLCDEGYVQSRQRSGYYVIYKKSDFFGNIGAVVKETGADKTDKADMPLLGVAADTASFPFSVLSKTMRRVILDYNERLLVKSPNKGVIQLRNQICHFLKRSRGIDVSSEQIVIGSGAEYLYGLVVQLLGNDKIFAIENPSYEKILKVYSALGVECEMLKLYKDGISAADLSHSGARVLHVTPFNSFPSAITVSISKKHEYLNWAKRREAVIIEDNYDSELTVSSKAEDSLFSMAKEEKVIYLNTFSKTISPSVRVGYMVLPESMLDMYEQKIGFYSCPVPLFEQYVLSELLEKGDYERHINRVRRNRRKELQ